MKFDLKSIVTYTGLIVFIGLSFFSLSPTLEVQFIQGIIHTIFGVFLGVQIEKNRRSENDE